MLKKQLAAKKNMFVASCSNPITDVSNFSFDSGINLPRWMLHEKFHPNPYNTLGDIVIGNKISSKMLHFTATQ